MKMHMMPCGCMPIEETPKAKPFPASPDIKYATGYGVTEEDARRGYLAINPTVPDYLTRPKLPT